MVLDYDTISGEFERRAWIRSVALFFSVELIS